MQYKYSRLFSWTGKPPDCFCYRRKTSQLSFLKFRCCILLLYLAVSHGAPQFSCTFVACDRYSFGDRKTFLKEEIVWLSGFLCKGLTILYVAESMFDVLLARGGHWPWLCCVCYYCSKSIWGFVLGIRMMSAISSYMFRRISSNCKNFGEGFMMLYCQTYSVTCFDSRTIATSHCYSIGFNMIWIHRFLL